MNSLKELGVKGLKELKDSGLKDLKANYLKDLILKPKTADVNAEDVEDLAKSREEIKKKIRKLRKEEKEIEVRIERARRSETEKIEGISEFPWREEIFPPLPRKVRVKISETPEVENNSLHAIGSGVSEVKAGGLEIVVKGTIEKPKYKKTEDKKFENIIKKIDHPEETTIRSEKEEGKDPKSKTEEQGEDKTQEEKEKIKAIYPFSAGRVNKNTVYRENSSSSSIEKKKTEKENPSSKSLFGNDLIEELLNSDNLDSEEEQSFTKYLEIPEVGELITDLKNVKTLLTLEERAG